MGKKILPVIAIVGNLKMARALSDRFARENCYFAILEEPWVSRPDADNEVIKRNNLLALFPHSYLVFAGCSEESYELMIRRFPAKYLKKIVKIKDDDNLNEKLEPISKYFNRKQTKADYIKYEDINNLSSNEQIAVIEGSNSIGEVIAENFCIANGYKILRIELASKELKEECEDLLRDWNCSEDSLLRNTAKDKLFSIFRQRIGNLEQKKFFRIIFFTRGLPYGILPFQSPVAHMFLERDLGLQILNGYYRIFKRYPGIALALICDPGEIPDSESTKIKDILISKGVEILDLSGNKATPYRFMHLIERYPFDFTMISSHAGEIDGRRITEEFTNPKGLKFEIVYDLYASFAPVPNDANENVIVLEMTVPVYINGISWSDKKSLKENVQTKNFNLYEFVQRDKENRKLIKTETRKGIKFSNALKLYKLEWLPALNTLGGERLFPIIFNNACSSWIEMAGKFIFAGASVYIGTTKDINTSLASNCGSRFIELAIKRKSMLYALFETQSEFVSQLGYTPYLYWGHPDIELRPTFFNNRYLRRQRIESAIRDCKSQLINCKEEEGKRKIKAFLDCILEFK